MNLDKTIAIAAALGWELENHATSDGDTFIAFTVYGSRTGPFLAKFYMVDDSYVVDFAAYAKAEMAKRGWASITNIYDTPDGLIIMGRVWGEFDGLISEVEVLIGDPTDPISEANALIDAIYAALEMEGAT